VVNSRPDQVANPSSTSEGETRIRLSERAALPTFAAVLSPPPEIVDYVIRIKDARQRLIALIGLGNAFPRLQIDTHWKAWCAEARGELNLKPGDLEDILASAIDVTGSLRHVLDADDPRPTRRRR
jgi:hypothetical protein